MAEKKIQIGGQAVIEGVMMRGPDQIATAIRRKDGSVDLLKKRFVSVTTNHPLWKLPVIRGFVSLIEMMIIGIKTLTFSAERAEMDYDDSTDTLADCHVEERNISEIPPHRSALGRNDNIAQNDKTDCHVEERNISEIPRCARNDNIAQNDKTDCHVEERNISEIPRCARNDNIAQNDNINQNDKGSKQSSKFYEVISIIFAFLLAFVLFGYVPYFLSGLLRLSENDVFFNLFAGSIRIVFFVLYVYLVSLMKEIKRVFEYHGAEHKAVFCHEQKQDLTIEKVQTFTTIHPRCGTSFMFLVLLIAIFVFSIIDTIIAHYWGRFPEIAMLIFSSDLSQKIAKLLGALIRLLVHLPFLPLISGISYEIIKLSSRKANNIWVKLITGPGMALQKITTRQPDDSQVEIAIIALKAALNEDLSGFANINLVEESK